MAKHRNFYKPFSNTGLGQQPTANELSGLLKSTRRKSRYYSELMARLKERALAGDTAAAERFKRIVLARGYGSKKKPTKIKLKFLDD